MRRNPYEEIKVADLRRFDPRGSVGIVSDDFSRVLYYRGTWGEGKVDHDTLVKRGPASGREFFAIRYIFSEATEKYPQSVSIAGWASLDDEVRLLRLWARFIDADTEVLVEWTDDSGDRMSELLRGPRAVRQWISANDPKARPNPSRSLADRAIAHYGETHDLALAGFILGDGRMLDFSEGSGGRTQDHRNVNFLLPLSKRAKEGSYGERTHDMQTFMRLTKSVRVMYLSATRGPWRGRENALVLYFQFVTAPTDEQKSVILREVRDLQPTTIQVAYGESVEMIEIDPVTPGRVREVLEAIQ